MAIPTFVEKVKKYFDYLQTDYGFKVAFERNSDTHPQTDGVVEYLSNTLVVVVDSEAGAAALWFYRKNDERKYNLDPVIIHEYLSTTDLEKNTLLSTNPVDQSEASKLFNQKFLLNQAEWKLENNTVGEKLEFRLSKYANWLKENEDACLQVNLLRWLEFYKYKIFRERADYIQRGKDELRYMQVKDDSGNLRLIKRSIFQDKLDYIEKLNNELSKLPPP